MRIVDIPEALRDRLGPEGSRALAGLLNEAAREMRSDIILLAEQRFERRLADELAKLRAEMHQALASVDDRMRALESRLQGRIGELESRFARLETAMADRMAGLETRLVRWAFGFWLGQFAALAALLFAFFRP